MRKSWSKKASVDELINAYATAAEAHRRATEVGDSETANRNADIVLGISTELRSRGREAQMALLPLLDHENPGVRCSAATRALEFAPEHGERVLEELAVAQKGLVGLVAEYALEQWRKGRSALSIDS